jgi:hypothetical protein
MESKATLAVSKRKLKQERGSAKIRPCGLRRTRAHTSRARSLMARQRSSHADQMTLWHALTHIGAHRPRTAPSCPVWIAHHPLPVASAPLQVAPNNPSLRLLVECSATPCLITTLYCAALAISLLAMGNCLTNNGRTNLGLLLRQSRMNCPSLPMHKPHGIPNHMIEVP